MKERWRPVLNFESLYEVSSIGRIRSLDREVTNRSYWGQMRTYIVRGKILKPTSSKSGHLHVKLYPPKRGGKKTNTGVHCLVLEAFVGPCPKGMQCCHDDGSPSNNHVGNLRWGTPQDNMDDRERHGRHVKGSQSKKSKLKEKDIPSIRNRKSKKWGAMSEVAREYGVSPATIRDIWSGRTWSHV